MQRSIWVLPFAVSFLLATGLTALLVRIAPQRGWVSRPRQDRWNVRVVAQFGGIPFILAASVATLFFFRTNQNLVLLLLTLGMALLGLTDDVAKLPPKAKLVGQVVMAGLAVFTGFIVPLTPLFWVNAAFTMFWVVGITNALNLLDNMDGLTGGVALIASVLVVLLADPSEPVRGLALCVAAAVAGFLLFNVNPARVFMGDVGALSLGFFLACACAKTAQPLAGRSAVLFVPCLILFVPIFDTMLVSVTRRINGRPISLGARDHSSHRLVWLGLSERHAALLLWLMAALAGSAAFVAKSRWEGWGAGVVTLFLLIGLLFWVYLAKLELPNNWLSAGAGQVVAIPKLAQQTVGAMFFLLLDAAAVVIALYFAYLGRVARPDSGMPAGFPVTALLVLAANLPLLAILAGSQRKWAMTRWQDLFTLAVCTVLATLFLLFVSRPVLKASAPDSGVLLLDGLFTFLLLALSRVSGQILDKLFRRGVVAGEPIDQPASLPRVQPAGGCLPTSEQLASETPRAEDAALSHQRLN
jgi:UDP-GlcNAc:undecaprenyl-phosphate GlcNAc-1-phosphate transferase